LYQNTAWSSICIFLTDLENLWHAIFDRHIAEPLGIADEMYMGFSDEDYPADRIATLINAFVEVVRLSLTIDLSS
jgi:hypothetical protein